MDPKLKRLQTLRFEKIYLMEVGQISHFLCYTNDQYGWCKSE